MKRGDSTSNQIFNICLQFRFILVFVSTVLLKLTKYIVFSASSRLVYRLTDEALIAKTAVLPIFLLINFIAALQDILLIMRGFVTKFRMNLNPFFTCHVLILYNRSVHGSLRKQCVFTGHAGTRIAQLVAQLASD